MATFKYPTGGGGSANPGAWTNIDAGDLTTNAQSYTTFNLAASAVEGYAHRINIGADIGAPSNTSNMATMGILTFDTGISLNSLTNGDGSNGIMQLQFEPAGVNNTSIYYTDTARPQTAMLWCGLSGPPFVAGDMVYYAHGLQLRPNISATNNDGWFNQTRIMRTQGTTTAPQGTSYGFAYPFKALTMSATFGQSYDTAQSLSITQCDFNSMIYRDDIDFDDVLLNISQVSDNTNTRTHTASDTIKMGVAFQVALSSDGSVTGWDFNLKWRKLLSV